MNGRVLFSVLGDLRSATWQDAISELVYAAAVEDKEAALAAVLAREAEGSTAIGDGVAVPHARISGIADIVAVAGRSAEGVAMGDGIVHIFVLILLPLHALSSHVDFLSQTVRTLSSPVNRARIMAAADANEIMEVLG